MRTAHHNALKLVIAFVIIGSIFGYGSTSPRLAFAQNDPGLTTNPGAVRDNDISVDLIPAVPGPNQNVKVTLSSYATNLNKATITWSLNGKQSVSGIGKTTFSFTTGDIGTTTTVDVALILQENSRVDKRITIQPSQVDLIWEATDSYVPAFYKGKAMPAQESKVLVVALPIDKDGSINPNTQVYNWKKNFVVDQANSGYGKYTFVVKNSYLDQTDTVSVATSSQSGTGSVGSITLNYFKPQIKLYEDNPALGLRLNKLLNAGFTMPSGEMTVSAQPFYFSEYKNGITEKNMQYKWTINGSNINPPAEPNIITLKGSTQSGAATIVVGITNANTLFQDAKQTINVILGK